MLFFLVIIGIFVNYSLCAILFCINFRCTAQWLDNNLVYRVVPWIF